METATETQTPAQADSRENVRVKPCPASLAEAITLDYLDTAQAEFYETPGGFTGLRYRGVDYPRVTLRRALPVGSPDAFISVADAEDKEIGLLRSVDELSQAQRAIVETELASRYYCPVVREVCSVRDKLGYVYFELLVERGGTKFRKYCAVKDVIRIFRMLDAQRLVLFDVDGNRYMVESLTSLDKKSVRRLEPFLF